jgi:transcriptional regulator with XRE-family HTH domain
MTLGARIKRERERHGWSQNELSRRAKVRQALLSELESGKRQDTPTRVLRAVARTLGVSMDYLAGLYEEDEEPAHQPALAGA